MIHKRYVWEEKKKLWLQLNEFLDLYAVSVKTITMKGGKSGTNIDFMIHLIVFEHGLNIMNRVSTGRAIIHLQLRVINNLK